MYESSGSLGNKLIDSRTKNRRHEMGLFDECLAAVNQLGGQLPPFEAKYCTVFFDGQIHGSIKNQSLNDEAQPIDSMSNFVKSSVAFCIPSSCNAEDLRSAVAQRIRHRLDFNVSLIVSVTSEDFCYSRNQIRSDSKFGIGAIITRYDSSLIIIEPHFS